MTRMGRTISLLLGLGAGLFLLLALAPPSTSTGGLINPSFEQGTTRSTLYWTPEGGPLSTEFGEINTPEGWTT